MTCLIRMTLLIPHLAVLHSILIPVADALGIQDHRDASKTELILIRQASMSVIGRKPWRRVRKPHGFMPWILAAGTAILLSAVPSVDGADRSSLAFTSLIGSSLSLACFCRTRTLCTPHLPPEPSQWFIQSTCQPLHRHPTDEIDTEPRVARAGERALLADHGHSSILKGKSSTARISFFVDSGASYHIHHRLSDLVNVRPVSASVSGVDRKAHQCTHIGDLPLLVCARDKKVTRFTLRNVRCVPTFSDSLLSVRQLWLEDGLDTRFGDACEFMRRDGMCFPFIPASKNLFLWRVAIDPQRVGSKASQPLLPPLTRSKGQSLSEKERSLFIHSSKAITHITTLHPDVAAQHLHRRLNAGVKRLQRLPLITADAPENLTRARSAASPQSLTANCTQLAHKGSRYVESRPGRLFHADIAGPFVKSTIGGYEYLLVLVDDHSRFKFAFRAYV